ncbi:MAG: hypothetical protein U9Q90_03980 [Campylobacterota bacterium]|nr:hypothetical protein [Campylobacterota bacterium]
MKTGSISIMENTPMEAHNKIIMMIAFTILLSSMSIAEPIQKKQSLQSPIEIVLEVTGDMGRSQQIIREDDSGEAASATTITVIQDGLLDDSTRGFKYIFTLSKKPNGTWSIDKQTKMLRCWKGRGHETFSKKPCH